MIRLSERLQACADLVRRGSAAVDVGTDHGYLALYLLEQGICPRVIAADLRPGPLEAARRSAARAGVREGISFRLSDGLRDVDMGGIGTVICAGMGADTIIEILAAAPAVRTPEVQLILQPQSRAGELRLWLRQQGFSILRERLSRDGKFLYTCLEARFTGQPGTLSPGEALLPPWLMASGDPLLGDYLKRTLAGVRKTLAGLRRAKDPAPGQTAYYETLLEELTEMEAANADSQ